MKAVYPQKDPVEGQERGEVLRKGGGGRGAAGRNLEL